MLRTSTTKTAALCAAVVLSGGAALVTTACGSPHRAEPYTSLEPVLDTPAKRRGALVFAHNCNQCHPGGEGGLGPALNSKPLPIPAIKLVVRLGPAQMPSFGEHEISGDDLDAVAEYVAALRDTRDDNEEKQKVAGRER